MRGWGQAAGCNRAAIWFQRAIQGNGRMQRLWCALALVGAIAAGVVVGVPLKDDPPGPCSVTTQVECDIQPCCTVSKRAGAG